MRVAQKPMEMDNSGLMAALRCPGVHGVPSLAALVAGRFRRAFFLLGIIPCIHVGQWPPLAATAGTFAVQVRWFQLTCCPASNGELM